MVLKFQPKVHWIPEIYNTFGRDYGRGFLEKEAVIDIAEVCKQHELRDLIDENNEDYQRVVFEEIKLRIGDACAFHKLLLFADEVELQFQKKSYA